MIRISSVRGRRKDLTILGIDTSGPVAGVCVWKDGKPRYSAVADVGLTHSETLMPMVDQALAAAGISVKDVELVACVAGPGSFTGVRIGVCAAKGFALARDIPCAQIDALEALAAGAFGFDGEICPILDARRDQVYCARFRFGEGALPERLSEDMALSLSDFLGGLPADGRFLFIGDGVAAHGAAIARALGNRALIAKPHLSGLRADAACYLAEQNPALRVLGANLEPIYLRKPQAERERAVRRGETA
jgi:tRNA threonylcarbamoyladenosine biosynthesis protein TsaB